MPGKTQKAKMIKVKTDLGTYSCKLESNFPEKGYTVTVPRVPEVVTYGKGLKEAKKMAKEALELACECLLEEGKEIKDDAGLVLKREHILATR